MRASKLSSDMSVLPSDAHEHPAYTAFVKEMKGKAYGWDPLCQAWAFFKAGWDATAPDCALDAALRKAGAR